LALPKIGIETLPQKIILFVPVIGAQTFINLTYRPIDIKKR
jgi:hypothetical protein